MDSRESIHWRSTPWTWHDREIQNYVCLHGLACHKSRLFYRLSDRLHRLQLWRIGCGTVERLEKWWGLSDFYGLTNTGDKLLCSSHPNVIELFNFSISLRVQYGFKQVFPDELHSIFVKSSYSCASAASPQILWAQKRTKTVTSLIVKRLVIGFIA